MPENLPEKIEKPVEKPFRPWGHRPTVREIYAAIKGSGGVYNEIAKRLKVNRNSIRNWSAKYPQIANAIAAEQERTLDGVESVLIDKALSGDMTAAIFYLKTKGRDRGYNDRQDCRISGALALEALQRPSLDDIRAARQRLIEEAAEGIEE